MAKLVVFSDLDGTLLDHRSYSFAAAQSALDALKEHGVPLVLATSKTAAEVEVLHKSLDLGETPAIVENGAGLFEPGRPPSDDESYQKLRSVLDDMPVHLRAWFTGFGDMTDENVARITGLAPSDAALARNRQFSEPGLWRGVEQDKDQFIALLAERGVSARSGGRFLTLSFGMTKADGLRHVARVLAAQRTVALGDAPNDTELLQAADIGIVVRNDHGPGLPRMDGEAEGRIRRTDLPGPEGWNEAVLAILNDTFEGKRT